MQGFSSDRKLGLQSILFRPNVFSSATDEKGREVENALKSFLESHSWVYLQQLEEALRKQGYTLGDSPQTDLSEVFHPERTVQNVFRKHLTAYPLLGEKTDPVKISYWELYTGLTQVDTYVWMAIVEGIKSKLRLD